MVEDIVLICALGLDIDYDNMSAPKTIPDEVLPTTYIGTREAPDHIEKVYGWSWVNHWKQLNICWKDRFWFVHKMIVV